MIRQRISRPVFAIVGLFCLAGIVPLVMFFSREPAVAMIMSIYVTMGIFLLLAVPNPAAHRSFILFAGWANVAHAGVMAVQEYLRVIKPQEWVGVVLFGVIGVGLIVLTPLKQSATQASAAGATR